MSRMTIYIEAGTNADGYWWKSLTINDDKRKGIFKDESEDYNCFQGVKAALLHAACESCCHARTDTRLTICTSSKYLLKGIREIKRGHTPHRNADEQISEYWGMLEAVLCDVKVKTLKMPNEFYLLSDHFFGATRMMKAAPPASY